MPQRNKPAPGKVGDALWLRAEQWKPGDPEYVVLKISNTTAKLLYCTGINELDTVKRLNIGPTSWWDEITVAGRWEVPDGEAEKG